MTAEPPQLAIITRNGAPTELMLPPAESELMRGVRWGRHERFCTPAYWKFMCESHEPGLSANGHFRLGRNLIEEVAVCLLGGYGMAADLGLAAFRRVRDQGLLKTASPEAHILEILSQPLEIQNRSVRYRYPAQKSRYLSQCLAILHSTSPPKPMSSDSLRSWLVKFPGIGPKTASWIVRNHLGADDVAILDVHIIRAGRIMGLFDKSEDVSRNYSEMERKFVAFSSALGCSTSLLDAIIWEQMRIIPLKVLGEHQAV